MAVFAGIAVFAHFQCLNVITSIIVADKYLNIVPRPDMEENVQYCCGTCINIVP